MKVQHSVTAFIMMFIATPSMAAQADYSGRPGMFAQSDFLAKQTITFKNANPEDVLNKTINNLRGVFERYEPVIDSSSKIVKPIKVSGPLQRPIIQLSVEKCVFVVCETVDLDAEMNMQEVRGSCFRNLKLVADLHRSSQRLTDVYETLNVEICYNSPATGQGKIDIIASAEQAPHYSQGIIQKQIFQLLQMQIKPMSKALNDALNANGAEF